MVDRSREDVPAWLGNILAHAVLGAPPGSAQMLSTKRADKAKTATTVLRISLRERGEQSAISSELYN